MEPDFLYEDFVQRLLYLDSVAAIQHTIEDARYLDVEKLYHGLDSFEQNCRNEGKSAQYNLVTFVRDVIDSVLGQDKRESFTTETISTPDALISKAMNASNSLRAFTLLRRHRHLLSKQLFENIQNRVIFDRPGSVNEYQWLILLCLMSLLLDDKVLAAKGYILWASYCTNTGHFRNAERHLTRAVKLSEDMGDDLLKLMATVAKAHLYEEVGDTTRAIESYAKALSAAENTNDEAAINSIRDTLAHRFRSLGRYSEALEHVNACLPTYQKLELPGLVSLQLLKGLLLEDLGRYEEGEVEYQRAAELAKSLGDRGNQFEAMNNIAGSFQKRGNVREEVKRFREIVNTVEGWGNSAMIASSHNNLGNALLDMGRPSDALAEFHKALTIKLSKNDWFGQAISYVGMGDAWRALGEYDRANNLYSLALLPFAATRDTNIMLMYASRIITADLDVGEDKLDTIRWARDLAKERGEIFNELQFASLLIKQQLRKGDEQQAIALYREAIERGKAHDPHSPQVMHLQVGLANILTEHSESFQEGYNLLTDALALVERNIREVVLDQRRAEIISEWIDLYGALIGVYIKGGGMLQLQNALDPNELAFNLHESAKSRTFAASLASTVTSLPASIPQNLQDREAHLLELEQSLQDPASLHEFASPAYRLQRLREIEAELQACWDEMRPFSPEYVQLRSGEPSTLRDLRSLLSDQSETPMAFVSFFCDDDSTTCFAMRSDEKLLHVFRSDIGRKALNEAMMRLRRAFNGAPNEFPPYPPIRGDQPWKRNNDLRFLDELSEKLLKFLPAVQGAELLCVAPHGPLHLLPLHALRTPDGKFLIEQFAITYCPSLSTLRYCLSKNKVSLASVKPSVYVAGIASRNDAHPEFFEHDDQVFNPHVWNMTSDVETGAASRSRILQQVDDYDVVHLTCHGYFDDKDPLNSGLLFSNGREKPPHNPHSVSIMERSQYLVTARDFLRKHMNAAMVTLRACSTGFQANRNHGDEFEGLSRALLYAGNSSGIVSLWNVDQKSSQQLIARFYQYWAESGKPLEKWRALWMAQKDFLNVGEEAFLHHPYHWAPLVLIGDWR